MVIHVPPWQKSGGGLICDPKVEDDTIENLVLGTFFT
jgi:hypothetical protein